MTLALASVTPTPVASSWASALADLAAAHEAVVRAHQAMLDADLGDLLPAVDAWRAAEAAVTHAEWREEVERQRAHGRPWLRDVGGEP